MIRKPPENIDYRKLLFGNRSPSIGTRNEIIQFNIGYVRKLSTKKETDYLSYDFCILSNSHEDQRVFPIFVIRNPFSCSIESAPFIHSECCNIRIPDKQPDKRSSHSANTLRDKICAQSISTLFRNDRYKRNACPGSKPTITEQEVADRLSVGFRDQQVGVRYIQHLNDLVICR